MNKRDRTCYLAIALVVVAPLALAAPGSELPEYVVIISIDGMKPDSYVHPDEHGLKIPVLRSIAQKGCSSPGAIGVYPTVTYPSHTSMMTGRLPADHGILANTPLDPFDENRGGWYYYAEQIKVPTLWQIAKQAGKKTAGIAWPVTVGADLDYNIPEYRNVRTEDDLALMRAMATPGLVREIENRYGVLRPDKYDDLFRARAAAHILTKYRPNLLLLHLVELDHEEHAFGPLSPEANRTLEKIDSLVGFIQGEAEKSGLAGKVAWFIVSDHGFRKVTKQFHPRVALRGLGYLTYDDKDKLTNWRIYPRTSAGSVALVAKDPNDTAAIQHVTTYFRMLASDPRYGLQRIYSAAEMKERGGHPDAFLVIIAAAEFMMGSAITGPMVTPSRVTKGTHGYDPADPELFASMLLQGQGIRNCQSLQNAHLIDIGPTAAALLGTTIPSATGKVLLGGASTR